MKIVIAGSYRQYRDWLKANGYSQHGYRYVSENEHIMGLELAESDIIQVGTHWESKIDRTLLKTRIRKPNVEGSTN